MKLKQYHLIGLGKIKPRADPGGVAADDERRASRDRLSPIRPSPPVLNTTPGSSAGVSAAPGQSQRVGPGRIPDGLSAADWLSIQGLIAGGPYLKASNTGTGDRFGISLAISGDTVVAGSDAWGRQRGERRER